MEFNQLIFEKLGTTFQKNGLFLKRKYKNYLRFQSTKLTVVICYNHLEYSNTLWVSKNNDDDVYNQVEVDNDVMTHFFHSDLKLSQIPVDTFINNLLIFFNNEGKFIFSGDLIKMQELENYNRKRSIEYTNRILIKQNIEAANNAWNQGSYSKFIEFIDKVEQNSLTKSLKLKYDIAKKKISTSKI